MSKVRLVSDALRRFVRTSFGAAVAGGLVVGIVGLIAIAAGWVKSSDGGDQGSALAATPLPQPAPREVSGKGLTVNQIYQQDSPGVVFIQAQSAPRPASPLNPFGGGGGTATGSGFVIDHAGHILTNAHVVDGAQRIEVTLGNTDTSQPVSARVVGKDPSTDVALLQVDAPSDQLHPLALGDSSQLQVGDSVVAIGNPFGLDRTVTSGIVSAIQRAITAPNGYTIDHVIQTDASINHGNSGGPLLNGRGEVIGVNSQIETGGSGSGGNVGVGFAVPSNTVKTVIAQLIRQGRIDRAFIGISAVPITRDLARVFRLPVSKGLLVQSVQPGSGAAKAGLKAGTTQVVLAGESYNLGGDIIVEAGGAPVASLDRLRDVVAGKKPGDKLQLKVYRGSKQTSVAVELGRQPAAAG